VKKVLGALAILSAFASLAVKAHPHNLSSAPSQTRVATGFIVFLGDGISPVSQTITAKNMIECKRVVNQIKQSWNRLGDDKSRAWTHCINILVE